MNTVEAASELRSVLNDMTVVMAGELGELFDRAAEADPVALRALVVEAYPEIVTPWAVTAAEASALWYEQLAPELDYTAVPAAPAPVEQLQGSAAWATTQDKALELLIGSAQRTIFGASRDTVAGAAERERGAVWARTASPSACPWCRMLATRGAVYSGRLVRERSGDTGRLVTEKGKRYHDNCRCLAIAIRPGRSYEPPSYMQRWEEEYREARDVAGSGDPKAIMAAYRELLKP
ncbi:hypothetical protein [Nocardia terpenica]|uniref:Phage head morphogenesis domain-containing protein n=1 Tax=Nocardia terpenica TaxID=455432 RepID=A0A164HFK8_9NOCA|nr:hypothetical protein [Nocardia terpenica]KZM68470.1 hypothetical protein AWN90_11405 [Nocardia terpenica]NQE88580.1 hypothetical protein [Nocardia terpenica]